MRGWGGGGLCWGPPEHSCCKGGPGAAQGPAPRQVLRGSAALVSFLCACLSSVLALGTSPSTSPGVLPALRVPGTHGSAQTHSQGHHHGAQAVGAVSRAGVPSAALLPTPAGKGDLQPQLDSALQDVNDMYLLLEETEKQAVRRALIEERGRFCTFITFLQPVVVGPSGAERHSKRPAVGLVEQSPRGATSTTSQESELGNCWA